MKKTKPVIVILDGHTVNPGDLSWETLSAYGRVTVYERTSPAQITERCRKAQIILTNKVPIGEKEIQALPELRYISVMATGYNSIDLDAARKRGVVVTNIPAYSTDSVAEHVFAFMLHFTRGIAAHAQSVDDDAWQNAADFSYTLFSLTELRGKVMGIAGYGRIGRRVAELAAAFGMHGLVFTRSRNNPLPSGFKFAEWREVLQKSDFISLHTPLTAQTRKMVDTESLALMKKSALLINTGRGDLLDESAVAQALNRGQIAGAALDVLSTEPPAHGNPLLSAKNCVVTPHIAWATFEARKRLMNILIRNLDGFMTGSVINQINP